MTAALVGLLLCQTCSVRLRFCGSLVNSAQNRVMKRFLKVVAALIAVFILAAGAFFFLVDANQFRPRLEAQLSEALAPIRVGTLFESLNTEFNAQRIHSGVSLDPEATLDFRIPANLRC